VRGNGSEEEDHQQIEEEEEEERRRRSSSRPAAAKIEGGVVGREGGALGEQASNNRRRRGDRSKSRSEAWTVLLEEEGREGKGRLIEIKVLNSGLRGLAAGLRKQLIAG